jgi:CRP-like cAMP-binding protein
VKHPGSYFGDDTAPSGTPLRESYRAATDAELLVLPADQLLAMLPLFPDIQKRISGVIGHVKKG